MPEAFKFPDEQDENKQVAVEENGGEGEVEIEIVDDTPEKDRGRKPLDKEAIDPTDEEIESYSDGVKKRISELTHARHDERRAKEALFREKQELERLTKAVLAENKQLKQVVNNGSTQYAATVKQVAESELDSAKRRLKEATEAFDTDAVIAAQEALFEAKIKLEAAKNFNPTPLHIDQDDVQTQQRSESVPKVDDKTLRWQAKNQWFGATGFEEITSFALGLHQKLVSSGVDPRSDSYFEQIDARVKSKFPEVFGNGDQKTERSEARRPSSVVAPASRSTGVKKVQLTASQAALIKKYNLDPKKYVAEVLKLEKQNG